MADLVLVLVETFFKSWPTWMLLRVTDHSCHVTMMHVLHGCSLNRTLMPTPHGLGHCLWEKSVCIAMAG